MQQESGYNLIVHPALNHLEHRPWPLPTGPWVMAQTWNDLLFAHWPIQPPVVRSLVPEALTLDTWNGQCWVAVAPFHMTGVRLRFSPAFPGVSSFAELNVRTYVTFRGKPGVFFFSLDAASRIAVWIARSTYKLPYFLAKMEVQEDDGWVRYQSFRQQRAALRAEYRPCGPIQPRRPGTLEHWLTERYCLYTEAGGGVFRADIHHEPWPLQDAEAEIVENTMGKAARIDLPVVRPLLHFAKKLDVLIWPLMRADN